MTPCSFINGASKVRPGDPAFGSTCTRRRGLVAMAPRVEVSLIDCHRTKRRVQGDPFGER